MCKIKIILFLFPLFLCGQSRYFEDIAKIGWSVDDHKIFYYKYPENLKISDKCTSFKNCKNQFPEQAIVSILSAKSYEWDQNNYAYPIDSNTSKYNKVQNESNKDLYFQPLLKIEFSSAGVRYAVVKFNLFDVEEGFSFCTILIKKDATWKAIKPTENLALLYLLFDYLSTDSLHALITNKKTGIPSFDNQIAQVHSNGFFNLTSALHLISIDNVEKDFQKKIIDPYKTKI